MRQFRRALLTTSVFAAMAMPSSSASATQPTEAIIDNGTVQLGVHAEGHLNVFDGSTPSSGGTLPTGLRYLPTNAESTAPGCLCEGWGIGDALTGEAGYANEAHGGAVALEVLDFATTQSTAVSRVRAANTFEVTHDYRPSSTKYLMEVRVSIKNITQKATDVRYRRVMDWDIEPTAFHEYVTMEPGDAANLVYTSNDGFAPANPLSGPQNLGHEGAFANAGPQDHGALFDFNFGSLEPGETVAFRTFYGAASSEADVLAALAAVRAEAYSLGKPGTAEGLDGGSPNTFAFAFTGVGGEPIFGCGEDGLSILQDTPLSGAASGLVHDQVEPAVAGVSPELADTVHEVNCDAVVPVESALDEALAPLLPPGSGK